jgi:hypothetical protein
MMVARRRQLGERVEDVGGIPMGHGRPPLWLMLTIVGIVSWGLFYLITYSISDAGSFRTPGVILRLLG